MVVMLVVGGGGGDTTPIESICPAKAETASAKLRTVTAHVWRRVFIKLPPVTEHKRISI